MAVKFIHVYLKHKVIFCAIMYELGIRISSSFFLLKTFGENDKINLKRINHL